MNDAAADATLTASYEIDSDSPHTVPSRVGRYEICEALGAGAMGVVYRARDPELDRVVAIKLVRTGNASRSSGARLLREAQAMARLRHPNVVPIFDVGPAESAVFVAMPLLEGGTLRRWLSEAPRPLDAILECFLAAGRGLAAAHAAGLVHRDFKPDNVLLGADGEVQVADFGLARLADHDGPVRAAADSSPDALSQTGDVVGTPAYMSPEQLGGRPSDARADQFSFCVALWEAVYGQRPFPKISSGTADPLRARIEAINHGPIAPTRRDRPAWIAQLLTRGLAADPDLRWPTLQELLDAIARHRATRRWPWFVAGLGAVVVIAAIVAARMTAPTDHVPRFHLAPLTHRGDLQNAAISPDGSKLAIVAGDSLVVQETASDAEDRVVIDHGIAGEAITWAPDNRHVLVTAIPTRAVPVDTVLVDTDTEVQVKLPTVGVTSFVSPTEVATVSYRERRLSILPLGKHAPPILCEIPGDYVFLWRVIGMPDGTMVVDTVKGEAHALVILEHNCHVRATFSAEPISSVAATDTGTLVALVGGEGLGEILEISLDGAIVSRRRVSGDLAQVLGRRHGTDYVSTFAPKTHLERVHNGGAPRRQFSVNGSASFSLAPDGKTLAWIERDGSGQVRGKLRLSTLHNMSRPRALLDHALMVAWSPDGRSLAVLIDDRAADPRSRQPRPAHELSTSLVIIDRNGTESRRVSLDHLDRGAAPVWLDDHRIAVQTDDRTTYRWLDLSAGEQGEITDSLHGSVYWLARSPLDGTLAMWRNGPPDATDTGFEHVWIQPPGQPARPLHVGDAVKHVLVPSWSSSGELLVRALETGAVSRVALDTGELAPIAQFPPTPLGHVFDDHVMTLPDGDLLGVEFELGVNVAVVCPDDGPLTSPPQEPVRKPL